MYYLVIRKKNNLGAVFLFTPFRLFLLPFKTLLAICNSTSASKVASVSCLMSGAKSPSLPVSFFPFLN